MNIHRHMSGNHPEFKPQTQNKHRDYKCKGWKSTYTLENPSLGKPSFQTGFCIKLYIASEC